MPARSSLSLVPGGIVACTDGQLQAIDYGTGIDAAPGPSHVALGANPLDVCDSVELSPIMPQIIAIKFEPGRLRRHPLR